MRASLSAWWRTNRTLALWTVAIAVTAGIGFGVWGGLRAGVLVGGAIIAFMAVLALSSATMVGSDRTLDRQIAMRERDDARRREADRPTAH